MKSIALLPSLARSFNKWCFLLLLLWAAPSVTFAQPSSICVIEQGAGGEFCDNDSDSMSFPGPFYVRIFLHIIRDSLGQGGQSPAQVEEALTFLDRAFNPHGIFFVRDCESVFVDQQPCFNAPSFSTPAMPNYADPSLFIPGGTNLFLFPDRLTNAQLNAGSAFGIPSLGLALFGLIDTTSNNMSLIRSFTIAHEMGHCLGLYHTHTGTGETLAGAGFCSVSPECANGSNCGSAGDYVCDTPADPILFSNGIINVDSLTCQWTLSDTDNCNGTPYNPDELNIMSYSDLRCYQYFTHLQAQRMKRHLRDSPTLTGVTITGTQISSDTTWNTANIPIDDILVVKSGSALTIGGNTTVKFSQQGRLIIEPGARLYLHGKLTNNECADTWKGVEVWGKASETQQPSGGIYQQGWLLSYSGASIENADIGLQLWDPDAAQGAGGMVNCVGTTFLNCRQALDIAPYLKYLNDTVPLRYSAVFTGCNFIVDEGYPHLKPFRSHISLRGVRGVRFIGCRYVSEYDPPSPTDIADYGYGIFAHDAGFEVLPRCVSSTLPCETYARSEFRGLGYGIWLGSEKFAHIAHTVRQADFHDCQIGLSNSGVSGGLMVLNNFYLGRPAGSSFPTRFGVALGNNLNGFTLEENIFANADPESGSAVGIWAAALGGFNNVIRRKTFIGMTASNFAFLQNAEATIPPRGLYYDCNTNQNTGRYDFLVYGSIKSEQGVEGGNLPNITYGAAGNKFSYTGSPDDKDFSNNGGSVNYHFYNGVNEEPLDYSGISTAEEQNANPCESNYCAPPCETPTEQSQRKQQYYTAKSAFLSASADYQTAVQTENPELAAAKSKLAGYYRKQMDVHAYSIVSHLLYDTATFHRDTFRLWLGNLDTYGARISLAGDYWAAGDTSSAKAVLQNIPNHHDLTTAEEADYNKVKYLFGRLYGKNIYNLSQNIIDELEVFAADSAGYAVGMSQTILRLYGRDYPPIGFLPGEERGQKPNEKTKMLLSEKVSVFPNPATNNVTFKIHNPHPSTKVTVQVSDISGRIVWISHAGTGDESIDWDTQKILAGIYFYRILTDNSVIGSGKIILSK